MRFVGADIKNPVLQRFPDSPDLHFLSPALFRNGHKVCFRACLRFLCFMASTIAVIPLGMLHMSDFQRWVLTLPSVSLMQ